MVLSSSQVLLCCYGYCPDDILYLVNTGNKVNLNKHFVLFFLVILALLPFSANSNLPHIRLLQLISASYFFTSRAA